jgi:hypothetical protein
MPKQCHLAISSRMTGVAMCLALGAEPLLDQEGGEKKNERKYTHTHTHHNISKKRKQPKTGFASVLKPLRNETKGRSGLPGP